MLDDGSTLKVHTLPQAAFSEPKLYSAEQFRNGLAFTTIVFNPVQELSCKYTTKTQSPIW